MVARAALLVALLAAVATALAGCGFQLRGQRNVDLGVAKALLVSQGGDLASQELRRQLAYAGVRVVGSAAAADIVVTVGPERFDRRVLSVDPDTGKVREFEIGYELGYSVRRPDGTVVLQEDRIELERDFTFDETAVLGAFEEQVLLERELRIDAAETMLRRLESVELK